MKTLVDGVSYLVTDTDNGAGGFYHGDTRHLSPVSVSLAGETLPCFETVPRLPFEQTRWYGRMGSSVNEICDGPPGETRHMVLTRTQRIAEGRLAETVEVATYGGRSGSPTVVIEFDADFADIFEVRGHRPHRDRSVETSVTDRSVDFSYQYVDRGASTRKLSTSVQFDTEPASLEPGRVTFEPTVEARDPWSVTFIVEAGGDESTIRQRNASGRAEPTSRQRSDGHRAAGNGTNVSDSPAGVRFDPFEGCEPIQVGDDRIDAVLAQSRRDVRALTTRTEHGPVPLAGAPWFVTMFGRDAELAAYLLVPFAPDIARGTIRYLAAHQGTGTDDATDERAGKIFHEIRTGELARTGDLPHTPYFGAVDTTPLWIVLLSELWRWSGDDSLVRDLWGNLEAALDWIDSEVAAVGDDPFLYYQDLGRVGVAHREWRDSKTGVQFADGTNAEPPLASAAVQGYVYDSFIRAAELVRTIDDDDARAGRLMKRAAQLRSAFDDAFWLPERSFYATGLTADGRQVDSVTSGIGQCLWSGIVPAERTDAVVDGLLGDGLFSGWGIRTLSAEDTGFDPISYHAGSVWPHDNALTAFGLANVGERQAVRKVAMAQFEAFTTFESNSVPELFCGFGDSFDPVAYAAACQPQAWAAATPYGFVRALRALEPGQRDGQQTAEPMTGLTWETVDAAVYHWD